MSNIKKEHPVGIKGILNTYTFKKVLHSWAMRISIFFLITCPFILYYFKSDYFVLLKNIVTINLSVFPNLLGFCIGGYALIIGFGHREIFEKMTKPLSENNSMSLFQVLSSIFAISILLQCADVFVAYLLSIIVQLELKPINETVGQIVNLTLISIMFFLSILSILLIFNTVVNIFTFGQVLHFIIRKESLKPKRFFISKRISKPK